MSFEEMITGSSSECLSPAAPHRWQSHGFFIMAVAASAALLAAGAGFILVTMRRDTTSRGDQIARETKNQAFITVSSAKGMRLKLIPAGRFTMGSPPTEKDRSDEEMQREVTIANPFYLGVTEVTQGQWKAVMGTEPWKENKYAQVGDEYPAGDVSAEDVDMFCRKLTQLEGREYRLPSDEEWEYACRAGTKTAYSFGEDKSRLGEYAWYGDNSLADDFRYAHAVGMKKPNAWGLYDMHGNLLEWTSSLADGPRGAGRVIRGGGFLSSPETCRSAAYQVVERNDVPINFFGFRVARVHDSSPEVTEPTDKLAKKDTPGANEAKAVERARKELPVVAGYNFNPTADETLTVKTQKGDAGFTYYTIELSNKNGRSRKYQIETFPTGKPFSIEVFINGMPFEAKAWWSNGQQSFSVSFQAFMPSGTWEFWDRNGETIGKIVFGAAKPRLLVWDKEKMTAVAKTNNVYSDIVSLALESLRR